MQFNMQSKNIAIIFWVIIGIILIFFHFRGLSIHDGGYIINSAQKMLGGEMIYKDFDFVYTPGSVLLTAAIFKIFSQSIFIERLFALIISLFTVYILYKLLKLLTSNFLLLITILIFYISWGPTHINFISPVMLSLTTGICTIFFLLKLLHEKNNKYLLYAGLTTGLTFLMKQNFGIMLFSTGISFFIFNHSFRRKTYINQYLIGAAIPLVSFLVFLILTGSLIGYINNFWFYTIQNIILKQQLTTQFFYGSNIFQKIIKATFYLIPVWVSIIVGLNLLKHNRKYLFICVWVILYYFVSIRPETDFIHLIPILSITGIVIVLLHSTRRVDRLGFYIFSISMIILGFYTGLFMGYYRWEKPLVQNIYWNNNKNVKIWTDSRWFQFIDELNHTLNKLSNKNDYLYIHANTPLLYFITERRNPTRFDFIIPYTEEKQYQEEIIQDLKSKKVKLVITEKSDPFTTSVSQFIRTEYQPIKEIDQFVVWKKTP